MLTLILGRGKSGKTTRLLQAVKDCPATGMAERIVIVPEQLSHQTERRLSTICGDEITFVSEVLSFTRLSSRVSSIYGGGARQSLDQGGRILTARLALESIRAQLKVFASAAGKADFLGEMVSMIDELKAYDVSAQKLLDASSRLEGFFAEKLRELALILGAYEAVMARGTCDPRDKLSLLRRKLLESDYAVGRHFFVDGFTDFSVQELSVLEALLRRGESMTVTVPCDSLEDGDGLFQPGRETALKLTYLAKQLGCETKVIVSEWQRPLPPELTYLEQNLLCYQAKAFPGDCGAVHLFAAADPLEECRHCAAEIRRQAMAGRRWREMAVAVGNTDAYGPLMEAVCREYEIPLYTGMKTPVTAHPAIAFLLCAIEAATEGMETETVTAYLKTGYSGVSPDDCDFLENYACTWGIRGSKWQKEWTEHPDGYDGKFTDEVRQQLASLNAVRVKAIGPLLHLERALKSAGNTRGQIEAIYRFLEETALCDQVTRQIDSMTESGQLERAQETSQIWNTLMECLQQTVSVLGQTAQSGRELLKVIRLALGQYELGTIPAALDSVSFGGVGSIRGSEVPVLFVLGVNEGVIPGTTPGGSLLTERERGILLRELDITLAPDDEGTLERELLQIYGAFTAPDSALFVSYAKADQGENLQPSFLISRLCQLFPNLAEESADQTAGDAITPEALAELYLTSDDPATKSEIRKLCGQFPALEQAIITAKSASLPRQLGVSPALSRRLFGAPVVLTASRLDLLGNCPLSFFLNYGLKARKRKEASFDAAEFGTFLHYILEKTVVEVTREQHQLPLEPQESAALVSNYMGPYLETRMQDAGELTPREEHLYQRNGLEAQQLLTEISQELSESEFRPCAFELQFGQGKTLPPLTVQGKLERGTLDGMVDRADLWRGPDGDYLRIVDYKSGSKKFDYTDLCGGVGMQMLLYLFALEKSGITGVTEHPIPAGALYFPAKRTVLAVSEPTEAEISKLRRADGIKRTGLVLANDAVLEAMEHGEGGKYLPVQKKKGGLGDYAITPQQMKILEQFVNERMGKAVDQIVDGDFQPLPFYRGQNHDPCQWCEYGDVCQKDAKFRRAHYQPGITAQDFWEKLGGGENG